MFVVAPIPVRGFICPAQTRQFHVSSASTGDARPESSVMAAVDMQARVALLEQELATVRAQADSDAINAEHQSQAMEARYNALEAEHSQVRDGRLCPRRTGISHPSPGFRARQRIHEIHARHSEHAPGRIDDPAPHAPRPSPSATRKLSAAFKIPDPHPICPPSPRQSRSATPSKRSSPPRAMSLPPRRLSPPPWTSRSSSSRRPPSDSR